MIRESSAHRIAELSRSAYNALSIGSYVTAYILCRAIMETESLFFSMFIEVEKALETNSIQNLEKFLDKCVFGAKSRISKEHGREYDPIHVLNTVRDKMDKNFPGYFDHYEFLSEFSHPNSSGLINAYVKINYDEGIIKFGKELGILKMEYVLKPLITSLSMFIDGYNEFANLLKKLISFCETLQNTENQ